MSDFESRLGEALASGAERAPGAEGLADLARQRAQRRRRTTRSVVAAVAAVAVAVPVGALALRDDDAPGPGFAGDANGSGPDGGVARDPAGDPGLPSGFRVESWHDVSVNVPSTWGHGSLATWCLDDAATPAEHVVERPGGVVPAIGCGGPDLGYGLRFSAAAEGEGGSGVEQAGDGTTYPVDAWVGSAEQDGIRVEVVTRSAYDARYVLSSVRAIEDVDDNGCPATDDGRGDVGEGGPDEVTVCRYDAESRLEQSERLTGAQAAAAAAAVEAAPPSSSGRDCRNAPGEHVVLAVDGQRVEVQYTGQLCSDRGLLVGDDRRELTSDVLYWALSPGWSGAWESWVPMPDALRDLTSREPPAAPTCPDGFYANSDFALDPDPGGAMTVCRMERDWDGESGGTYLLDETVPLTAADSDEVRAALAAAPVVRRSAFRDCRTGPGEFFLVLAGETVSLWVYNGECGDQAALAVGPDGDVVERSVTPRLLDALGSPYGVLR